MGALAASRPQPWVPAILRWLRRQVDAPIIVALPTALVFCAVALPTAPGPPWLAALVRVVTLASQLVGFALLFVYPILAVALSLVALLVARAGAPIRTKAGRFALLLAAGVALVVAAGRTPERIHLAAVGRVPARAAPLIASLEDYRARCGDYPSSLEELVPEFLPHLPTTGLLAYPEFGYARATQGAKRPGYELWVDMTPLLATEGAGEQLRLCHCSRPPRRGADGAGALDRWHHVNPGMPSSGSVGARPKGP